MYMYLGSLTIEFRRFDGYAQVLDGLEHNISDYEKMIGRPPAPPPPQTVTSSSRRGADSTLSGFTSRLVNAVNKITQYLREVCPSVCLSVCLCMACTS